MAQDDFQIPEPTPQERRRALRIGAFALLVIGVVLGAGSLRVLAVRSAQAESLRQSTATQQQTYVVWTRAKPGAGDTSAQVQLPGTVIAVQDVAIYARSNGFVRKWTHDIGSRVRKGEVLAEIETPELERQIEQARANVRQATVTLDLARSSLARWQQLRKDALVTEQEVEERRAAVDQQGAALSSLQAEQARLESLRAFDTIVAPFNGVVTRRNIEVGRLVNAGAGTTDQALFQLTSTDNLKLVVNVPQVYSAQVRNGMTVEVTQAERPGVKVLGKLARNSNAVDAATRTLLVEVALPGGGNALLPGSYVQARLPLQAGKLLTVPANTLLFRAEGPRIAAVDAQGKVALHPVTLGRDLGKTVEITGGITGEDHIVLNPPDALNDGDQVQAREAAPAAAK